MRVGVYVGSFNPIHNGHEKLVNYLLSNNILDKVIIVPTENYWDKQDIINIKFRGSMLKMVFNKDVIIDTHLSKYSYTYQIMENLSNKYDDIYLIIGADNMINFDKWKNIKSILKYHVIVLNRNDINTEYYVNKFKEKDRFIILKEYPYINISSTYIRDMIKKDKLYRIEDYINKDVLEYIKENHLYL